MAPSVLILLWSGDELSFNYYSVHSSPCHASRTSLIVMAEVSPSSSESENCLNPTASATPLTDIRAMNAANRDTGASNMMVEDQLGDLTAVLRLLNKG